MSVGISTVFPTSKAKLYAKFGSGSWVRIGVGMCIRGSGSTIVFAGVGCSEGIGDAVVFREGLEVIGLGRGIAFREGCRVLVEGSASVCVIGRTGTCIVMGKHWFGVLHLTFQCIGVVLGDLGTSPLYVLPSTFPNGIQDSDDILRVLSVIIYSILPITIGKYTFLVLSANDINGDGGNFAMYALISRFMDISLIPGHQVGDREQSKASVSMVIGDGILTPCISVISAVMGIEFGTAKLDNIFAPILLAWFFSIASIGVFNLVKYDPGVLQAFNPRCIWVYFSKNPKNAWKSLASIVLCLTGLAVSFVFLITSVMFMVCDGRGVEETYDMGGSLWRKRLMHELNNKINVEDLLEILNNSRIARLQVIGIFYGEDDQAIPLIFRQYASNLMAIPSILIFISHKPLPVRHVPLEKQLSFRRIYLDQPAFHCDVNTGYLETRMDENCFKEIVINRLIEFLEQHGEGEEEVACLYKAMVDGDITHMFQTTETNLSNSPSTSLEHASFLSGLTGVVDGVLFYGSNWKPGNQLEP
ncbi:hypothetical protein POTOM_054402 [Populus tomentosa]|uniref:Uncharacterized protein n=1 Tax=Populus tomentosa TaxID=118781 RepID=A0A8X8C525_POPTO|nr:hypothetical protein POTOM_054402 [Populus tomentosa]